MNSHACPLCASEDATTVATVADYAVPCKNVICQRCGFVFQDPTPTEEELAAYYQHTFIQGRHQVLSLDQARERAQQKGSEKKYPVDGLRDGLSASSRVLEIGCGYGFLLRALREVTGCSVEGVEPSAMSGAFAEAEYHIPVFHGTAESYLATPAEKKYDLIILHHVLEHMRHPVEILRAVRDRLMTGGRLFIAVPDVTHLQEPPESFFQVPHFTSFSPWTLHLALSAAGWKILRLQRKLRPPKNGMEVMAVAQEDARPPLAHTQLLKGNDPASVQAYLARVRRMYHVMRYAKRLVLRVLPASRVESFSLGLRRAVRRVRDRVS
ncbi:MAG: class I SAM-dependent methyltransferase [Patescibacteria group bacterium]